MVGGSFRSFIRPFIRGVFNGLKPCLYGSTGTGVSQELPEELGAQREAESLGLR